MTGYMPTALGDRYRFVFYNGKKWCRVWSDGFWGGKGGWTTVVHHPGRFDNSVAMAFTR